MNAQGQISLAQAALLAGSVESLRNLLIANGKLMPSETCKISRDTKHLVGIYRGELWTPSIREQKSGARCLYPPKKSLILDAIEEEIA